ncbi:unnamed protein product [Dibothriocephalus latus]|uniref:Lipocalin/cytosolic fatty-acid binding domain-containing protein n=1 Tax=Dibothriocephalus latus TaxID=60516 RepID=A0A3P6T4J2_DIBLA|nr:unnamed protein product [Dibothriocephalus latus]
MEAFIGSWELKDSEDLTPIIQKMGVTIPKDRLQTMSRSILAFARDGDFYEVNVTVGGRIKTARFRLNEEFEHDTIDGRHIKMMVKLEGNTLTIQQNGERNMCYEMCAKDANLTMAIKADEISCIRHYVKA